MTEENKFLVFEQYAEILDTIFNYQEQQVELRSVCSKIMIGTFALVGGLLFAKVDITDRQLFMLSAVFPFLSLMIVTISLVNDLFYKERLKLAFFSEALRLEREYNWLPQFHLYLLESSKKRLAANGQIVFYFGNVALLFLISGLSLTYIPFFHSLTNGLETFIIYLTLYIAYTITFSKIIKKTNIILEMLENG